MFPNPKSKTLNPKSGAFTLLELILAIAVAMLIIGAAVLSIGSLGKERALRAHAGILEATARGALQNAIRTGNTIPLRFSKTNFALGDKSHPLDSARLDILRAGESTWRTPAENESWTFHPSGLCEPIAIRITNPNGKIEIQFDPLTAAATSTAVEIFSGS